MEAAGMEKELEHTDWHIVNNWLGMLYPELKDPNSYKIMMSYVNPDKLADFYERRQRVISEFLEVNGQTGTEREYLLQMEQKWENLCVMNGRKAGPCFLEACLLISGW